MRKEGEGQPFHRGGYPGRPGGGDRPPCRACGPGPAAVARGLGDRPLSPPQRATGPFFSRDLIANLKKKKFTLKACRPMGGRPGYIFEIFQNGHIFLKF